MFHFLHLTDSQPDVDRLMIEGIFVSAGARGRNIGTKLLAATKQEARDRDLAGLQLEVVDTNPRARILYEREGIVAGTAPHLGPFKYIFGFSRATHMELDFTSELPQRSEFT